MTERSYMWDGTATGDASLAPYDKNEFNDYVFGMLSGLNPEGFIVPGYLDNLFPEIGSETPFNFVLHSGAALVHNYLYVSDEPQYVSLTIPAEGYYRVDRIVLRVDPLANTITLIVLEGEETTSLLQSFSNIAPLVQIEDFLWDYELARVLVDESETYNICGDFRSFLVNLTDVPNHTNLVYNSEFLGYSQITDGPEQWETSGSVNRSGTLPETQERGTTAVFDGSETLTYHQAVDSDTLQSIALTVLSVEDDFIILKLRGKKLNSQYTDWIRSGNFYETITKLHYTFDEYISEIEIELERLPVTTTNAGQVICKIGFHPHNNQLFQELVGLREAYTSTTWDGDAKSTGTTLTTLTLFTYFNAGTYASIMRLEGRDSGSAANACDIYLQANTAPTTVYATMHCGGITNDTLRSLTCFMPTRLNIHKSINNDSRINIGVTASGAGTLDAWVEMVGLIT